MLKWDVIDCAVVAQLEGVHRLAPHVHGEVRTFHRYTIIYLDPKRNGGRRYTWRHTDKGDYPTQAAGRTPPKIPPGAEEVIFNTAEMFGKVVTSGDKSPMIMNEGEA